MNLTEKKTALSLIDERAALFEGIADRIWENPELSLKEFQARDLYCRALRELGFSVTENLCGIGTAFCGSYGSGRPVIGILGEFDALSGLSQEAGAVSPKPVTEGGCGHGCGHNLLGAGSLAAAAAVKAWLEKTGRPGTVVYYGCPGEEGGAGKAFMAREGLWKQLDAALTWHPGDTNQTMTGTNNSCIQVLYEFHGIAAHAAGNPEEGRSALDAVELMNIGVQFLREHMTDDCRIHYAVTDTGGISPNVSVALQKRVDAIAEGAALMTGTSYTRTFIDGTADTLPNFTLEQVLYRNLEQVGVPAYTDEDWALAEALKRTFHGSGLQSIQAARHDPEAAKRLKELTADGTRAINDFLPPPCSNTDFTPGSTDVGDVSWLTPTAQIETACWPAGVPGHSWQIVACGKSGLAHKGMLYAAKALAGAAIDLMSDESLLQRAREEFDDRASEGYVCPIEPDAVPIAL